MDHACGAALFAKASQRWVAFADALAAALGADDAARATDILRAVREHLHRTRAQEEAAA